MSASAVDVRPRALEQRPRAQRADHVERLLARERGEPHRDVAEHLGRAAAGAARHDRPEALVGQHADEHLDARVRHPLDEEVLRRRAGRLEPLRDLLRRAPHRGRAVETEPHGARLRLVHDAGRDALQRDRARRARPRPSPRRRPSDDPPLLDQRDPVGAEQRRRPRPAATSRRRARATGRARPPPRRRRRRPSRAGGVARSARTRRAAERARGASGARNVGTCARARAGGDAAAATRGVRRRRAAGAARRRRGAARRMRAGLRGGRVARRGGPRAAAQDVRERARAS